MIKVCNNCTLKNQLSHGLKGQFTVIKGQCELIQTRVDTGEAPIRLVVWCFYGRASRIVVVYGKQFQSFFAPLMMILISEICSNPPWSPVFKKHTLSIPSIVMNKLVVSGLIATFGGQ
ncbi:TPA: hypothetical protein OZL16_002112 [Legionella pneumophila]|nr:hypothetical protein [Legionella pneumophila]HCJ4199025.1 hypothetical protein [Legionella pneumophila]HCJ4224271.1 hypothetical protein [Legionella pneumophila]HCJ4292369.1 hypothetical protein [Legionella pneumophila]HCX3288830.1 hypothetical protein [Legionella pneumophila]